MHNFTYCNPTSIVFGRGSIAQLGASIPEDRRILMTYGRGSIKRIASAVGEGAMAVSFAHERLVGR